MSDESNILSFNDSKKKQPDKEVEIERCPKGHVLWPDTEKCVVCAEMRLFQ